MALASGYDSRAAHAHVALALLHALQLCTDYKAKYEACFAAWRAEWMQVMHHAISI